MYNFREATDSDFGKICNLIKSKQELFLVFPKGNYPLTVEQVQELAQQRKELTVMECNNTIVGFANFYNFKQAHSAFIGNVIIDKKYRGKGLGKKLILHMLKIAEEKFKLAEIRISVFNENTTALLLYLNFGFVPYAIEEKKDPQSNRVVLIHLKKEL